MGAWGEGVYPVQLSYPDFLTSHKTLLFSFCSAITAQNSKWPHLIVAQ